MFLLIDLIFWGILFVAIHAIPPLAFVAVLIVLAGGRGR